MTSKTNMLILAFVMLAILGADAVFSSNLLSRLGNPEKATETEIIDKGERKNNENQRKETDKNNFEIFLNTDEMFNIAGQERIGNMTFTDLQVTEQNRALDLNGKMNISCVEPHMYVKGNYITVSQIESSISARMVDDSCRGLLNTERLKYMSIFALNALTIDVDIQKRMNLTIIAPKWEIIGKRRIQLDGEDGKLQDTAIPADGKDGKPGEPGKPSANFFGIGEEFIGGENLVISVSGGRGSRGQDGGKGEKGKDGTSPIVPSKYPCDKGLCQDGKRINHLKCDEILCIPDPLGNVANAFNPFGGIISAITDKTCTFGVKASSWYYRIYGEAGHTGRNGGNGGKGGEGGNPGEIAFFELNGPSGVTKVKNLGSKGLDGKGGVGGTGGRKGNVTQVKCEVNGDTWSLETTSISNETAASGQNGTDGKNTINMKEPIAATRISNLEKAKTINQYKRFLRDNLDTEFTNSFLLNFLNRLENNQDVKNVYDTMGFVNELQSLEDQYQSLNRDVNFLRFYESLLDRISNFAKEKDTDKRVLGYLYTATLGRIHNLEDDLESSLVADITSYLESVKHDIEKLKDLRNGRFKEVMTNKYKQNYKNEIDKKIRDAEDLITTEIKPAINSIETEIDKQIESLINEVIALQNKSTEQSGELAKKEKLLEQALVLEAVFGSLKIISQVASLAGPVGAVAGSAIGIGTSVAESFDLGSVSDDSDISIPDIKDSLNGLKDQLKNLTDQKANTLEKTLESADEEMKKNPKELGSLSDKVEAIKNRLFGTDKNKLSVKDVQGMETDLKNTLEAEKNKMKNEGKLTTVLAIDKVQKAVKLASVVADAYNKYQKKKGKLDVVRKAIEKNEETFDNLKKYEEKIYTTMVPMLDNMKNNLDNTINQLDSKGQVDLHVTKWKVKSTLKDLMSKMEQATKAFNVSGSLKRCIEKLQDAMVTLINVQDYIQDYQKDQTLADFIAGVSSNTVNDFDVSYNLTIDNDLREALIDLEITISSSIVIQRYKVAINAFKQFVFPFAHIYLKGLMRPSHFTIDNKNGNKLDEIVSSAILNIEHLQSKLQEYKMSINIFDECIGTGDFKENFRPFFVWRDKDTISRLLSGKEVIIKANVRDSPTKYDAIKFNHVVFYFKAKPLIRRQIDNALKNFMIKTTHLGDSQFRYGGKIYAMPTADVRFWYTFKTNRAGEPGQVSASYNKLIKGDFMLSPYATWKIQIEKNAERYSFNDLERFNDTVEFALGGKGHYVLKNVCPDLKVDKYYNAIDQNTAEDSALELNVEDSVTLFDNSMSLF